MAARESIAEQQLAVLIDFENTGLKSIQWLFDQVSDIGRIIVKRAYADWSVEADKRDQLLELGIEPVHLFRSSGGGKNSSDIRLAIDAIDLLHQSPVDTFIIVSSDSDFVPLVSKLRSAGKTVIGAGREATVSRTLVRSCDRYFYLEQSDKIPSADSAEPSTQGELPKEQVNQLLMRAIRAAIDEQGRVVGSKLGLTLQRLDPSFDYRSLGYSTFMDMYRRHQNVNVATVHTFLTILSKKQDTFIARKYGLEEESDIRKAFEIGMSKALEVSKNVNMVLSLGGLLTEEG